MSTPTKPNEAQMRVLQNASVVPVEAAEVVRGGVEVELPPNAAYVLEVALA